MWADCSQTIFSLELLLRAIVTFENYFHISVRCRFHDRLLTAINPIKCLTKEVEEMEEVEVHYLTYFSTL